MSADAEWCNVGCNGGLWFWGFVGEVVVMLWERCERRVSRW